MSVAILNTPPFSLRSGEKVAAQRPDEGLRRTRKLAYFEKLTPDSALPLIRPFGPPSPRFTGRRGSYLIWNAQCSS
jgi:hypothetical protein